MNFSIFSKIKTTSSNTNHFHVARNDDDCDIFSYGKNMSLHSVSHNVSKNESSRMKHNLKISEYWIYNQC